MRGDGEWEMGNGEMKSNRYPKYKPTGIAWLPEVPEGWEMVRNKRFLRLTDEKVCSRKNDFTLLSLTRQGVIVRDMTEMKGKFPKDFDTYLVVRPNNLVFCLFDVDETPRTVGLVRNVGMLTGAYTNFEVDQSVVIPEFAYYYYLHIDDAKKLRPFYTGLRKVVKTNTFLQLRMPLPPLAEQRAIVAFLDGKCGKIDRWVAAKEREVALLKELKQAMIAEAVTGATHVARTDTARKMKPSGIPWLPEVPEGWEVKRVATLLKIKDCPSAPNEELLSVFLDRGVIRFSEGGEKRANATSKDLSRYQLVEVDDFVMNNQQAWRGSVGISRYRGIVSPAYFVVRLADCIDSKYAEYAFRSRPFVGVYELCSRGVGSIQRNLIWNMFKQQHLPLPPLAEQRAIVAYIEARAAKIDAAVAGLEREVAAMKEYKQRLIADVVTGQKKVA